MLHVHWGSLNGTDSLLSTPSVQQERPGAGYSATILLGAPKPAQELVWTSLTHLESEGAHWRVSRAPAGFKVLILLIRF